MADATVPKEAASIRDALAKLSATRPLAGSPILQRLLSFVVEEELAGRGDRLKAYTVAVQALGRAADFDPQSDPIVRVHAWRLRRMLDAMYADPALGVPIRLRLSAAGYRPSFAPLG